MDQAVERVIETAAHLGRRVLYATSSRKAARSAFVDCLDHIDSRAPLRSVAATSVYDRERITFSGSDGRIYFRATDGHGHRGLAADILVVDPTTLNQPDKMTSLLACIATSEHAELWVTSGQVDLLAATQASLLTSASHQGPPPPSP